MKFEEAIIFLKNGKKVRRKDSGRIECYNYLYVNYSGYVVPICKNFGDYILKTSDFNADDWEIVKETKKIKLRDLTKEQFEKYCKNFTGKYTYGTNCDKCVFHNVSCNSWYDSCWIKHKDLYSDKFLDQEIEIEEE